MTTIMNEITPIKMTTRKPFTNPPLSYGYLVVLKNLE